MIRQATIADLDSIVAIYNQAVLQRFATADLDTVCVEDRQAWFRAHTPEGSPIYVYQQANRVVGWCSIDPYRSGRRALSTTGELVYYVDYDFHRRGIGSALLAHTLGQAPGVGKRILFSIILESNKPSIKFLQKFGFEKWAHLPNVAEIDGEIVSHVYYGKQLAL